MKHMYCTFCRVCDWHSKPKVSDNTDVTALCGAEYNTGYKETEVYEILDIPCDACFQHAVGQSCPTPIHCNEKWEAQQQENEN